MKIHVPAIMMTRKRYSARVMRISPTRKNMVSGITGVAGGVPVAKHSGGWLPGLWQCKSLPKTGSESPEQSLKCMVKKQMTRSPGKYFRQKTEVTLLVELWRLLHPGVRQDLVIRSLGSLMHSLPER